MTDPARTTKEERDGWREIIDHDVTENRLLRGQWIEWDAKCLLRLLDDADAADALRAQVAALQVEKERLRKAYDDVVAGQEVLIQLQRREWPLMQAELAAAQAKLAVPVPDDVQSVVDDPSLDLIAPGVRSMLESLARDNAGLRTQAEALERERDGLHSVVARVRCCETLDEIDSILNEKP